MQQLQKNLTTPNQKIIATWPDHAKRVIYAHCGLVWPQHPTIGKGKNAVPAPPYAKILNFTGEDATKHIKLLEDQLIHFQRIIGIRSLISDTETDFIINYLGDHFADFTAIEIPLAYHLAVAKEIPVADKDLEHYDVLEIKYLSRLLTPYRNYRQKLLNLHVQREIDEVLKEIKAEAPTPTPAELFLQDKNFCITTFNTFTTTKIAFGLNKVYDVLYKYNLLNFTDLRKAEFKTQAIDRLNRAARQDTRTKTVMQAFAKGLPQGENSVIQESKKVAIETLFLEMFNAGTSIEILFEPVVTPN